ncbi:MAG: HD domain-containing protein [Candidatus Omnitrophica bacterium]|nr:HD domain-containing protein [Candidatus Omnitrophota bacterium]
MSKKINTVHKNNSYFDFISELDKQFTNTHELSFDKILKQSVKIAPILLNAKICNLRLIDSHKRILTTRVSKGLSKDYTKKTIVAIGDGIAGKVAAIKKPIVIKDTATRRDIKFKKDIKKEKIRSLICVPILLKKETMGTLTVYGRKVGKFKKSDSTILMNFANHIAILIDNVRVHKKIFNSYMNTIKSLVSAVEARDAYTRGHSEKVTDYALAIAGVLGLSKEDRIMLTYCGRLHDIGKIAISDLILNKPGRLTETERAEIEIHPAKAVEILSNLKFLESGIPAIKHHHERYDGGGYPDGLRGEEIPLLARIIGCTDAFDAMTSDRAYRSRMSAEKAIEELKINRGKQFDPDVLDAFLGTLKDVSLA